MDNIAIHLLFMAIGFFIIGGGGIKLGCKKPGLSSLWSLPVVVFIFVSAIAAGMTFMDW